jgi:YVTN family beta-propeller protein
MQLILMALLAMLFGASLRAAELLPPLRNAGGEPVYLSPSALAATPDGKQLFIACATANRVLVLDTAAQQVSESIPVPEGPLGLALSADGRQLFVTCAAPRSTVCILDVASRKVLKEIPAGHTAMAPVSAPDGRTLYICNRFNDCVALIDLEAEKEVARIPVPREPVALALTADGKFLLAANHLPAGPADRDDVAACVSVIDLRARKVIKNVPLPSGSTTVRGICISPDGQYACVTHVLGQFRLPTTQTERGWIENNALTLLNVPGASQLATVLLDNLDEGAANPWAVAWTPDGKQLCVTHAGTHELSILDAPALLRKVEEREAVLRAHKQTKTPAETPAPAVNDLTLLAGVRQRIKLNQKGPRSLALIGSKVYIGNYFADSLSVVDLSAPAAGSRTIPLGPAQPLSIVRQGELAFNDASLGFQGWQSCASCHSSDGRVDGLNWDLLNDGLGNPKNAKSLLFAFKTPPNMALGVRANAQLAVRAGFSHILFVVPPEETATAVDAYLESLKPSPSPRLEQGQLSKAAARGRALFLDPKVGCATCHPADLYTDLKPYDVGTGGKCDKPGEKFFTPTLVEVWRTAPYLHDGSAATMRDVLTTRNRKDQHGKTSHLTRKQIEDLAAFVLSL